MNTIIESVNNRIAFLKRVIRRAEKEKGSFPEGRLRTSRSNGRIRYYKVSKECDTSGEYLPKNEQMCMIRLLAQKDYNKHFLKSAADELEMLEKVLVRYQKKQSEAAYEGLSEERQNLVTSYIPSDDQIAEEWQSKTFKTNPYKIENKIYDTRRGEKVRSKSEAIIADMLFEMGIPYHYEYPVRLRDGKIKYPDFTLFKKRTGEVVYLEHFGFMDDESYRNDTLYKMDIYRANGIYPGKNLLFTYETTGNPLDIKGIRRMLKETML